MALAAIALLWQLNRQMFETDWVEHTDRVMLLAETAKTEFLSAQSALRGFLLSEPLDRESIQQHWNKARKLSGNWVSWFPTIRARNSG
jgi:CHASE3 domain sensor protein